MTAGATEAIAASVLALCDPGDEILAFEPTYDSYTAVAAMAGRPAATGDAAPARVRGRRRRAGGARQRPHAARSCSTRRTTPPARCSPPPSSRRSPACASSTTSSPSPTRSTSTSCSTASTGRCARSPAWPSARSRSARPARRSASPAGRSAGPAGPTELVTAVRTAKQFLTYVNGAPFQPAVAVGLGLGDDFYAQLCRHAAGQARPALRRAARRRLRGVRAAGHLLRHRRHPLGGRRRRPRVLPFAPGALRGGGGAELGLLRGPGHRPAPRALRVLQAHRGAHRGRRAPAASPRR